jgi:hypothetical protein
MGNPWVGLDDGGDEPQGDEGVDGGKDVIQHDAETTRSATVDLPDGRRFGDVKDAEEQEGSKVAGQYSPALP